MAAKESPSTGAMATTEQRLQWITTCFVLVLMSEGSDPCSIRRSVMEVARRVIDDMADNEYEVETHTAIVQRTIGTVLTALGIIEEAPCAG
jgi:hypothetical protein